MHTLSLALERLRENLHLVCHHERRVEAEAEVADDSLVLVLRHELLGTREGNLVDVAVNLLHGHADASVGDGECF